MMTRYHVDSEAVLAATSNAHATINRVQGEITSLTSQLQSLQSSWSGSASLAFQQVLGEWKATHAQVEAQLVSLTQTLGQAAQHYADLEAQNTRLFMR
ncbi:WXG100 family type VII secretion target, partial [Pontimonas sp.]|jgi:WXG100 family type VII secretion target|uniref:WXG100 family type VII secretion target n=1 Tax=Pontimonas sp. TaxID=2304492 RepID=UPI00287006EB